MSYFSITAAPCEQVMGAGTSGKTLTAAAELPTATETQTASPGKCKCPMKSPQKQLILKQALAWCFKAGREGVSGSPALLVRCCPTGRYERAGFKVSKQSGRWARIGQGEGDTIARSRCDVPREERVLASLPCSRDRFS